MSKDIPGFAEEYTLQHIIDDMAIFYVIFHAAGVQANAMAVSATKTGLIPKDKADFTWQVLYPALNDRFVSACVDLEFAPILKSIYDGTYDRWGSKT